MANFKIGRGMQDGIPEALTDGMLYYCTDTTNLFIDYTDSNGNLVRSQLSANYADKLRYVEDGATVEIDPKDIALDSEVIHKNQPEYTNNMIGFIRADDTIESPKRVYVNPDGVHAISSIGISNAGADNEYWVFNGMAIDKRGIVSRRTSCPKGDYNNGASINQPIISINSDGSNIVFGSGGNVALYSGSKEEGSSGTLVYTMKEDNDLELANKQYVDSNISSSKNVWYGTCNTDAATAAKVVTTAYGDFVLTEGAILYVRFDTNNTADSSVTLNVDGTGDITIYTTGTNNIPVYQISANTMYCFVYDGSGFRIQNSAAATDTTLGGVKVQNEETREKLNSTHLYSSMYRDENGKIYSKKTVKYFATMDQVSNQNTVDGDIAVVYSKGTSTIDVVYPAIVFSTTTRSYGHFDGWIIDAEGNYYTCSIWNSGINSYTKEKNGLPTPTTDDNNKVLSVVDGAPVWSDGYSTDTVRYSKQALDLDQRATARENIDAASIADAPHTYYAGDTIISETTVTNMSDDDDKLLGLYPPFVEGATYIVTLNGTIYECVARYDSNNDCVLIGNGTIYGDGNEGNGEPFSCDSYESGSIYLNVATAGDYTISISAGNEDIINKIDEKYIPDTIARTNETVLHSEQTLTDDQKFQARSNIGAEALGSADAALTSANAYTDEKVSGIVNSAPETLDTLNELAAALGNDENFATTVATQIGNKVDKVDGKGLSTEDFTTEEKEKLAGISTKLSGFENDAGFLTSVPDEYVTDTELTAKGYLTSYTETDPTVPDWAKSATKPTYTASEVGALPDTTTIPTKTSDLTNDSGYLTAIPSEYITETELAAYGYLTSYTETDPTVPAWAKEANKPTYTAAEVGALPADTVIPSIDGLATESYVYTAVSAKITAPTIATVGQILRVKAVDTNGAPTEWETVDYNSVTEDRVNELITAALATTQSYYTGTADPEDSLGSDGDIYLKTT